MSKNIAVSDDVYKRLKREKKGRSFSELLRSKLDEKGTVSEVTGKKLLNRESFEEVKKDVEELSSGTLERMNE